MLQAKPQLVPSQAAVPFIGVAHGVHDDGPHEFGLVFGWHVPLQSWLPLAQTPEHDALDAMQTPAHSFIPDGHVPPHIVPSQVAAPPVGTGQDTQAMPQFATSLFCTQIPTQLCVPAPQALPASLLVSLLPASGGPASPSRPRSLPASIGRSVCASAVEPLSTPFVGMLRLRAVVQPPVTIIIPRTAAAMKPSNRRARQGQFCTSVILRL